MESRITPLVRGTDVRILAASVATGVIVALVVASCAGVNWLGNWGYEVYPFGHICIALFVRESGRHLARSPVLYSRLPGSSLNGSGTKHSAVRAARW